MRTEIAGALTRDDRIDPEDLDLAGRSLRLCAQVTARPEVRRRLRGIGRQQRLHTLLRAAGTRGLERAAAEMLDLYNAGARRDEIALYVVFLAEVERDLYVGTAREPRALLEVAEAESDTREDLLQVRALVAAQSGDETPEMLRERAAALRTQGTASAALADRLEFDARRLERGRVGVAA